MTNVGKITAEITVDDSKFNSGINQAEGKWRQLSGKLTGPIGIGISAGAAMAAINMVIGAAEKLIDVIGPQAAIAWEAGLGNVFKTTNIDKGTEAASRLNDELLQLRATMRGVTSADIQAGAGILGSLGIDPGQIQSADKIILQATAAFDGLNLETSAKQLGTITNLWREETSEVGGAAAMMEKAGSAVNALGNAYSATEANILSFLNAIGGTATQYNESVAASAAIGALFETKGVSASEGATGINTALMEGLLSRAVDSSKTIRGYKLAAQMLGLSDSQMKQQLSDDLYGTIIQIVSAVDKKGKNAAEKTELGQALFGAYGWKYLSKLAGTEGDYKQMLAESNAAFAEGTSLQEEYARQTDNLTGALSELGGAFEVATITAWDAGLEPAAGHVETLAQAVRDATPAIEEYADAFGSGDPARMAEAYQRLQDSLIAALESLGPRATDALKNADWEAVGSFIGTMIGANIGTALTLAWDGAQWIWDNRAAIIEAATKLGEGIAQGIASALKHSSGFQEFVDVGIEAFNALGSAAYTVANAIGSAVTGAIKEVIYAFADLVGVAETGINWAQSKLGLSGESTTSSTSATPSTMYRDTVMGRNISSDEYEERIRRGGSSQVRRYVPIYSTQTSDDYMESLATRLKESGYDVHVAPAQVLGTGITVQNIWNGEGYIKDADKIAATDDSLDRLKQGWSDTAWNIAAPLAGNSPAVQETFDSAKKEIQSIPESQRTTTQNSILAGIENREKIQNTIDGGLDEVGDKLDNLAETGRSTEPSEKTGTPWADEIRSKADKLVWEDRTWKNIESPTIDWFLEEQASKIKGIFEETGWAWEGVTESAKALSSETDKTTSYLANYNAELNLLAPKEKTQSLADSMEGCDCALSDFAEAQEAMTELFASGYIGPSGENYLGYLQQEASRGAYRPANITVGFDYEEEGKAYMDQLAHDLQDDSKWSTTVKVDTTQATQDVDALQTDAEDQASMPITADGSQAFAVIAQIRADAAAGATMPIYTSGGGYGGSEGLGNGVFESNEWAWDIPSFAEGSFVSSPTLAIVGDRPGGEIVAGLDQLRGLGGTKIEITYSPVIHGPIYGVDDLNAVLERNNRALRNEITEALRGL